MNWDRIEGKWKEYQGRVREKWGKLTDDEFAVINGKREKLAGLIQQRYGLAKDEVERQISDFERSFDKRDEPARDRRSA